jgi:hypothetical protein
MTTHTMIVQLAVQDGAEDAYRAWHDRHIGQILANVPGFVAARRLELDAPSRHPATGDPKPFVALYELTGNPATAIDALRKAGADGLVDPPPPGVVVSSSSGVYAAR